MSALTDQHERWQEARGRLWGAEKKQIVAEPVVDPGVCINLICAPSWRVVARLVAAKAGVDVANLIGPERRTKYVIPRQDAMLAIHEHCPRFSLPQIGEMFGGRDHTTVLYSIEKARARKLSTLSSSVHNPPDDRLDAGEPHSDKRDKPNASVRYPRLSTVSKVVSIAAAKERKQLTLEEAWEEFRIARDKAWSLSGTMQDGIAAGKAFRRWVELFTR